MGNPYYWPQLWSINEQVTNPHWIYPGNRIVFRAGTVLSPPELTLQAGASGRDGYVVKGYEYERAPAQCGPDERFATTVPADKYQSLLFLSKDDDLSVFGEMKKARQRASILSERDTVYLDVEDPDAFECGDMVQLFKKRSHLRESLLQGEEARRGRPLPGRGRRADRPQVQEGARRSRAHVVPGDRALDEEHGARAGRPHVTSARCGPSRSSSRWHRRRATSKGRSSASRRPRRTRSTSATRCSSIAAGTTACASATRSTSSSRRTSSSTNPTRRRWIEKEDEDLPYSVVGRIVIVRVDDYVSTAGDHRRQHRDEGRAARE